MMNALRQHRQLIHGIVGLIGGLGILGLAYALDSWREYAGTYYRETFRNLLMIYGSYVLGNVILSAAVVWWAWFMFVKCTLPKRLYLILVLPGVYITVYPLIYFSPAGSMLYAAYRLGPAFQIYLTGGIVAMVGIVKMSSPTMNKG